MGRTTSGLKQMEKPLLVSLLAVALMACQHSRKSADIPLDAPDAWYSYPCLPDSADSFEWTRYDLRGIRIRVPADIKRVPHPEPNELLFQKGRARMRLRLHNDASQLFAQYGQAERGVRVFTCELVGQLAEAMTFVGPPTTGRAGTLGYAVRWPDADRGEWLTAVITATSMADATALRRTLFTIAFPK